MLPMSKLYDILRSKTENLFFRAEKIAESLSLKRCDLENLRLNNSFSMINIFSSDPDRARAEKSAHLDFEIKRLEGKELQLKEDIKQMESEMEHSIEVSQNFKGFRIFYPLLSSAPKLLCQIQAYHQMRSHQITNAFHLFAASQVGCPQVFKRPLI